MLVETVCSAVSAAGLGIAAITAYRKRFLAATRLAAYSLVPVGLVMTGAVGWISDIAFRPVVWAGFGVLALAWLLFMTTRAVERRTTGTRKERRAAKAAQRDAVAPAASAPAPGAGRSTAPPAVAPAPAAGAKQPKKAADEDFSDIEAILKKHGI
ncbi:hypothetical protein ACIQM4_26875 [Streptomyces sp. NPDC091272]|uniref:hypothetical protein n=1 Tax=Streptomyces sp. NPDC091272 TaxID=3365981 RepID=UPI0037FEAC03